MRRLLLIPATLMVLWCCSKGDDIYMGGDDATVSAPIAISVDTESLTRGAVVETEAAMASVGLYCAYTAQEAWSDETKFEKMSNAKFKYNEETLKWDYDPNNTAGQPSWGNSSITDKYSFFAYSPHSSEVSVSPDIVGGVLELGYTVGADYNNQVDLLVATPRKDIYPQVGGKVCMSFNHALSLIKFSPTLWSEDYKVASYEIEGVAAEGTMRWSDEDERAEWGALSNFDQTFTLAEGQTHLLMMPQAIPAEATLKLTVVNTSDAEDTFEHTLSFGDAAAWVSNTSYNYQISISAPVDPIIEFSVSVVPWGEELEDDFNFDEGLYNGVINRDDYATFDDFKYAIQRSVENEKLDYIISGHFGGDTDADKDLVKLFVEMVPGIKSLDLSAVSGISSTPNRLNASEVCSTTMESIKLPINAETIGNNSFAGWTNLKKIESARVKTIGASAFAGTAITSFTIGSVETLGASAFKGCTALASINLSKVQKIESSTFEGCTALKLVTFVNVADVGSSAFAGCTSLSIVNLNKATSIGFLAFRGCTSLGTLSLKAPTTIAVVTSAFMNASTGTCILYLHINNPSVVSGNMWAGYTWSRVFKSY